jgi:hypothetical protein
MWTCPNVLSLWGCIYPPFISRGMLQGASRLQCDPNHDSISTCLLYIYIFIYKYNYLRLREHTMFIWNLLDGGLSHSSRGDLAVARCWCQVMLTIALPWWFGRGTMLMPSHAGDDVVVAIWLWHDVYAESCWRQCYQVILVTTLLIPSNGAAEATLVVAQCSCWVMLMTVL